MEPSDANTTAITATSPRAAAAATIWTLISALPTLTDSTSSNTDSSESLAQQVAATVQYLPLPRRQAFTAPPPPPRVRRKRGSGQALTNSERGCAFRSRQHQYELSLLQQITDLQTENHRLERVSRDLQNECVLQTRTSATGSLVQLVRLYHDLFRLGSPAPTPYVGAKRPLDSVELSNLRLRQRAFLQHAVDPDLQLGMQRGIGALTELWRRYTQCHLNLRTSADAIEVIGTSASNSATVVVHGTIHAQYMRATLAYLFPHATI